MLISHKVFALYMQMLFNTIRNIIALQSLRLVMEKNPNKQKEMKLHSAPDTQYRFVGSIKLRLQIKDYCQCLLFLFKGSYNEINTTFIFHFLLLFFSLYERKNSREFIYIRPQFINKRKDWENKLERWISYFSSISNEFITTDIE